MATPASAQPYQPGSKLNIRNHAPPPPYGAYYENTDPVRAPVIGLVDEFDRHQVDQLDIVLRARGIDPGDPGRDEAWEECGPLNYRLLPPEQERLDILARIIEGEVAIWWHGGVQHGDLEPRNVIISCSGPSNAVSRVAIIDFNAAYVLRRCERGRRVLERRAIGSKLPISPIERYWSGSAFNCRGAYRDWIPDVSDARALDWLVARWKGSPNYHPLTKRFLGHPAHGALNEHARRHLEELRGLSEKCGDGTGDQV